ncbi:MAG: Fic family protein [Bacilli bacterium]|jgi:Fic family protein|nr:Fic family protein [Bacilli bacterium]
MVDKKETSTYRRFFTLSSAEFDAYVAQSKKEGTVFPLRLNGEDVFYHRTEALSDSLILLTSLEGNFHMLEQSLSKMAQEELIRSCLVEEIYQTNLIEGVHSTRKEIFRLLDDFAHAKKDKITSIVNKYRLLLKQGFSQILNLEDIRHLYDALMEGTIIKKDQPDGILFRKDSVAVTDGVERLHEGLYPEERIDEALRVVLSILNSKDFTFYERSAIAHYLFEYAHPFYDGNGRMGRYLLSLYALEEKPKAFAFRIAATIGERKGKYYRAFKECQDIRNRNDLATFVGPMLDFYVEDYRHLIKEIQDKKAEVALWQSKLPSLNLSKGEKKTAVILVEGSIWSAYGVSKSVLASALNLDERSVQRHLASLEKKKLVLRQKIGRQTYFRLAKGSF